MSAAYPPTTLRVALVQAELHWHDPEANFDALRALYGELARKADLVVLPEAFTTGFTMRPAACGRDVGERAEAFLTAEAAHHGVWFCGSTPYYLPEVAGYVNRLLVVGPSGEVQHYDKRHRFTLAGERDAYAAGSAAPVVAIVAGWRILLQVCYDLRFPVFSRNRSDGAGAYDVALYVANWPSPRRAHWTALLRARAIENQCYAVGVNRVGEDGNGLHYAGDSAAFDALGASLIDLGQRRAAQLVELDGRALAQVRARLPFLSDGDGFALAEHGETPARSSDQPPSAARLRGPGLG